MSNNKISPKRYRAKQVADILRVNKVTLFNWEDAKKIPYAKRDPMNNYRYYTEEDVRQLRKTTKR